MDTSAPSESLLPSVSQGNGFLSDSRASGVLLHISSLPSPFGVGDLGSGAFAFVDFLARSGQQYWQVLPLSPTNEIFANSPYMSSSAFAGNPLFISPELLSQDGLLRATDFPEQTFSEYLVDFPIVTAWKSDILHKAWKNFQLRHSSAEQDKFFAALQEKYIWLREYSLFMALKERYGQQGWWQWPEEIRHCQPEALDTAEVELLETVRYYQFEQHLFYSQWDRLHAYAQKKGIQLIGDLPIYVGLDSTDVWAHQQIFTLSSETGLPTHVAGVPPDYFSETGQLWGNPLYRWESTGAVHEELFTWWKQRLQATLSTVDLVRVDHFRGFEAYWSVPAKEKTALAGSWKTGPGIAFFEEMKKQLGDLPIIAEDLGVITPAVEKLRDDLGFPGMKILLFAFDGKSDNVYLPHNMSQNCVVYTGTHDNDTTVGWYLSGEVEERAKELARLYANCHHYVDVSHFHKQMIYLAQSSVAALCILPMQDVLGFGNDCRMNKPGTACDNWLWRCSPCFITDELASELRNTTALFGRLREKRREDKK
ncbi:MAG: 4-alpha-glucanotransferase [Candidatus Electrothrix aestuarii]|uniref:4-alpha-glucanotransferase n=1 Tax=Candidatus Electrothrix aestuarii TaxID=3062594 RepID=A0AAU8LRV2_9BACT|nr:4-alpha-glucanotransferase [Candidatus Electrothrix aestuarii]